MAWGRSCATYDSLNRPENRAIQRANSLQYLGPNPLDGGPPKGEAWHRELLRQMTMEVTGMRPSVISAETAEGLDEYRRFRHVVRNVYAEHLDLERVGKLVGELAGLWRRIKSELTQFVEFLEGVSRADDTAVE